MRRVNAGQASRVYRAGVSAGVSEGAAVPGTSQRQALESFGAVNTDIQQNGVLLDLAAGKTATLRIPLASRSTERPSVIPLYYYDEATNLWVASGSATLQGQASTGYYYEGQVSRLGLWNADKPITSTVTVTVAACWSNSSAALRNSLRRALPHK